MIVDGQVEAVLVAKPLQHIERRGGRLAVDGFDPHLLGKSEQPAARILRGQSIAVATHQSNAGVRQPPPASFRSATDIFSPNTAVAFRGESFCQLKPTSVFSFSDATLSMVS